LTVNRVYLLSKIPDNLGQRGENTMLIYLVTNAVNGVQYVGITSRKYLSHRKYGHFKHARDGKGGSESIWEAIRKYGEENFSFETIENASDIQSLREREIYWIEKLNTLKPNGYNQNKGGSITTSKEMGEEYQINGKSYFGFGQLADAFDLQEGTVRARIKYQKWTVEQAVGIEPRPKQKRDGNKIIFRGKSYSSERDLCRDYSVPNNVFRQRYHNMKWTLEESLELCDRKCNINSITVLGKNFKSRTKAAEYYGIKQSSVTSRLNKGWTLEKALTTPLIPNDERRYAAK
jgi:group I intron endonuclease